MKNLPCGSWPSPITAELVSKGSVSFADLALVGGKVYWVELRPEDGGRKALMVWDKQGGEREILSAEFSVRTRVHEYGGGALLVTPEWIYFVNDKDQQIYGYHPRGEIKQITARENTRFADGSYNRFEDALYYVMEEHTGVEVINSIVRIDLVSGALEKIAEGNDFYSNPRVSPDGFSLAYITWNHPNMPWDGTELWVREIKTGDKRLVAGGQNESVLDPQWSPEGKLHYVSDRSNWWNIYQEGNNKPVWSVEGECVFPPWNLGLSLYGFSGTGIVSSVIKNGTNSFVKLSSRGEAYELDIPYTDVEDVAVEGQQVAVCGMSSVEPMTIALYNLATGEQYFIKRSYKRTFEEGFISKPRAIEFPTVGNRTAHAFYYPPTNPYVLPVEGEKPPLLVLTHGGPTAHKSPSFDLKIQFWTSRGFAVVDVNYGGSTGYGREYRDRLKGTWGIVDIDDCTHAALYCVEQGLADANRLAIAGGSAGGYTTLAALAFRDVFKVGANYYGVSDLELLAKDTHKFEARYLDQLVGPYPAMRDLYIARAPIHNTDSITCPVIIFQGDEDAIVTPEQSEVMYKSLLKRGIPTAYLLYQGEQHGFRKAENISRSLEAQLYFFAKILGFPAPELVEPLAIDNFVE